jgi:dolichol kinase
VAALIALIALIHYLGDSHNWSPEVQRKAVHVAVGLYALTLPVLFDQRWPVVLLILVTIVLMLWLRRPASRATGLGAAIHSVERRSWGDILLALAIGFVFLRAGDSYILYALPIAVVALSDAAAALTGSSYGRRRFAIEDGVKSWEGVVAFFAVTWILSMVMLLLVTDVPRLNVVVLSLAIALFGATVEAVSWRGLDNLFVPICIQLFLMGYLHAPPATLALLTLAFLGAILLIVLLAPRLGLGAHASRAFVVAIFSFLGVAGPYGTVLPALIMLAHLAARKARPCRSGHADLDFIGMLSGAALIWLFVGETVGPTAINLYNMSLAGILLAYLLMALGLDRRFALAGYAAVLSAYILLIAVGPHGARWAVGLPETAAASLALVMVALVVRTGWFDRWRAPRIAAVASIVPMTAYLTQTALA